MVDPPFEAGVKDTVASALPAVAETPVGAFGMVYGVAVPIFEGEEAPMPFSASLPATRAMNPTASRL